jgi:hypothetical protein
MTNTLDRADRTIVTPNYRKFYGLLRRLPGAEKEELVREFTGGRTEHVSAMHLPEFSAMLAAVEAEVMRGGAPMHDEAMDKARKRLMACIGGYLAATGKSRDNLVAIKAIALRAAGGQYKQFNRIPHDRLVSLYNAFLNRQKDVVEVASWPHPQPLPEGEGRKTREATAAERLQGLMQEASDAEEYELAAKYKRMLEKITNRKITNYECQ